MNNDRLHPVWIQRETMNKVTLGLPVMRFIVQFDSYISRDGLNCKYS